MKIRVIIYYLNLIRILPMYLCCFFSDTWKIIIKDIERNLIYRKPNGMGEKLISRSNIRKFGFLILFDNTFRNVIYYRLKQIGFFKAAMLRILFPIKKDCEIQCGGGIGPGLVICHGHGTVILAEKIGENFTCYQGVTVGKNPKGNAKNAIPAIGDNVSIYTNAVVAGPITVGNDVSISAGVVCLKSVPDNMYVFGNGVEFKSKEKVEYDESTDSI